MDVETTTTTVTSCEKDEDSIMICSRILDEIKSKIEANMKVKEEEEEEIKATKSKTTLVKKEVKTEELITKDTKILPPPPPPPPPQPSTTSNYFGSGNGVPMIMWPKDRVMITRLENIIQMFENNGEWPVQQQRNILINPQMLPLSNSFSISNLVGNNNTSSSSGNSGTIINNNSHISLLNEQRKLMMSPMLLEAHTNHSSMDGMDQQQQQQQNEMYDYNENSQNDSEFSQPSKYGGKPKRGRPPRGIGLLGDMASGNSSNNGRQIMASLRNRSGANNMVDMGDDYSDQDQDDYDDYMSEQQQQVMTFFFLLLIFTFKKREIDLALFFWP
jgi:hypothetical protein